MGLVVQKFGGTSVANAQKMRAAAQRVIDAKLSGNDVIVAVSARGKTTDELHALANELSDHPPVREMDQLLSTGEQESAALMAIVIDALGHRSVSFTGAQAGIRTDSYHSKAKIRSIDTARMRDALSDGNILIVAGFQGIDENANITTLGRGASDTTAVALAAAMNADACEIYTDVPGVFTADPRIVPDGRKLSLISYDEMLELASLGAGVLHTRSVEFAKKYGIPIHVRSASSDEIGTFVCSQAGQPGAMPLTGVALRTDEAKVTLLGVRDVPGMAARIIGSVSAANINIDMIVQNVARNKQTDFSFTVAETDLRGTIEICKRIAGEVGAHDVVADRNIAKVSAVGEGMRRHSGVAAKIFAALAGASVNLKMISTSQIKVSCVIEAPRAHDAMRAVHAAFDLADAPETGVSCTPPSGTGTAVELPEMESILVSDAQLTSSETKITVLEVADVPGSAAELFTAVADAGVNVNVILQNSSDGGTTDLSFTTSHAQADAAVAAVRNVLDRLQASGVTADPDAAVVSVAGVGLRSHAGVARMMFSALAEADINIRLISTSESEIACVVDKASGPPALAILKETFDL